MSVHVSCLLFFFISRFAVLLSLVSVLLASPCCILFHSLSKRLATVAFWLVSFVLLSFTSVPFVTNL